MTNVLLIRAGNMGFAMLPSWVTPTAAWRHFCDRLSKRRGGACRNRGA
ncbi:MULTISPECIES: hypothetical protein [unclassified Rhizobium]|nr:MULTISPECIES: hypothetical protein [unclassified Rhizobium]